MWQGIAGAVLAFTVLASVQAWTIPIYQPADEASHVGYGVALAKGQGLPTIDTPIPVDGERRRARWVGARDPLHQTIWTANHPPLYYTLAAVPLGIGERTGHGLGGVRAARLLSVALAALGLLLLAWLLLQVLPGRPVLAVTATGLVALVPSFVNVSALVYNDALAFLTTTAALAAATRFLLAGPSAARLAAVAATASVAALSRASGLFAVAVAVVAVLAGWWRAPGATRARLLRGLASAALVVAAAAVVAGWFYLRNLELYGSITGSEALLARFGRPRRGPLLAAFVSPGFWIDQQRRLWDATVNLPRANVSYIRLAWLLCLVPAIGLLLGAARLLRRWLPRRPWRRPWSWIRVTDRGVALALWLLLLALLQYSVAQFNSAGGNPHVRYIFPGLAIIGLLLALGLAELPGGRRGLPALGMLALLTVLNLWGWLVTLGVYVRPRGGQTALGVALAAAGVAPPVLLVPAALLLAAGLALLARAVRTLAPGQATYQGRGGTTLPAKADDLGTDTSSPALVRTTNPSGSAASS